jgi:hypothetical protein
MYESDDIVAYLYRHYGAGRPPIAMTLPYVMACSEADSTQPIPRLRDPNVGGGDFVGVEPALRHLESQYSVT